jgi:transcriptional regulator with XRE-family HTH domain
MSKLVSPLLAFGREVRRRREGLGMTLEELASRSGLTPNYIGHIENGHRDPSLTTITALAAGLEIDLDELFPSPSGLSPVSAEASRLWDRAPPSIQAAVLNVLRWAVAYSGHASK